MLETKILVVMFRMWMPENEQLSVVKTSVVEKVFTDKESQESRGIQMNVIEKDDKE